MHTWGQQVLTSLSVHLRDKTTSFSSPCSVLSRTARPHWACVHFLSTYLALSSTDSELSQPCPWWDVASPGVLEVSLMDMERKSSVSMPELPCMGVHFCPFGFDRRPLGPDPADRHPEGLPLQPLENAPQFSAGAGCVFFNQNPVHQMAILLLDLLGWLTHLLQIFLLRNTEREQGCWKR